MLSKLAVRRLTKLADYMDSLPPAASKHFRMLHWFKHKGEHEHPIQEIITKKDLNFCGTSACAMGWAATLPAFRKAGLSLTSDGGLHLRGFETFWSGMEIPEHFFQLGARQTQHLFGPYTGTKTPKEWAARCRKFLRENA